MKAERYLFFAVGLGMIGWPLGFYQASQDFQADPQAGMGFLIGVTLGVMMIELIFSVILQAIGAIVQAIGDTFTEFGLMLERRRQQRQTKAETK